MLDGERFRHHRTDTAVTGKSREGHQQMAEQWEQQFHAEWNSNRLSTVSKSALRLPFLPKSAIRHTQAHIDTNFRDDHVRRRGAHPRDSHESLDRSAKGV